jgi:hypothetical protein
VSEREWVAVYAMLIATELRYFLYFFGNKSTELRVDAKSKYAGIKLFQDYD